MGNLAPERLMETNIYSTRVQAPTISHPDAAAHSTHNDVDRIDEETAPNPVSGRAVSEGSGRLMKAKRSILVSTLNCRTLRKESKRSELANLLNEFSINILGIVDHKIVHDEEVRYEQLNKCTMITTSAWRNSNGASSGGVGLMINNYAKNALADISPFENKQRILIASFNGNPATTIIVHYSPVEGSPDAESHYENLSRAINEVPKHNVVLVIGDFNGHIGNDQAMYTYHQLSNTNGNLMKDLALENNLAITNTHFQKKEGKLWT